MQPVLFAIEYALAKLWHSWGLDPDAVIGHGTGEIAAARCAGVLSLYDAAKVICRRSKQLRSVKGYGAMASVGLGMDQAREAIAEREDRLGVAASNGPRSSVISGASEALDVVLSMLGKMGIPCQRAEGDVALNSPQMDPLRDDLREALRNLNPRDTTKIPMYSTVTGEKVRGPELDGTYWVENLCEPVLFSSTTQRLIDTGHTVFVEVSPHPVLLSAVEENLRDKRVDGAVIASLRREGDERRSMLEALGALYVRGYPIEWTHLYPARGKCVPLPTYPWQRERHSLEGSG
jgi:acyl transferase domain-containing protein